MGMLNSSLYRVQNSADITITSTSQKSTALSAGCVGFRLATDTECRFLISTDATATALTTSTKLPAGGVEYVKANSGEKVAVIGTAGNINISELTS